VWFSAVYIGFGRGWPSVEFLERKELTMANIIAATAPITPLRQRFAAYLGRPPDTAHLKTTVNSPEAIWDFALSVYLCRFYVPPPLQGFRRKGPLQLIGLRADHVSLASSA